MKTTAAILLAVAALCCGGAGAAVPQALNYQGYLVTAGGAPVNGAVQIVFKLYTAPSGAKLN
jgi:hypothetical protein